MGTAIEAARARRQRLGRQEANAAPPPAAIRIARLRRPQLGNHKDCFSKLHYAAGRRQWGKLCNNYFGSGKAGQWSDRAIAALPLRAGESEGLFKLFVGRFLDARSLLGVVEHIPTHNNDFALNVHRRLINDPNALGY